MKVLFLGGTGRLSKDVAKLSLEEGNEVYLLTRGSSVRNKFVNKSYHMIYADVRNSEECRNKIGDLKFDIVVDFLSFTKEHLANKLEILDGCFKQYIFISSATAYIPNQGIISENSAKIGNTSWDYAYNKWLCEEYIKQYFENKRDIHYTIVRPYVTYGNTRVPYPIVPFDSLEEWTFIERIKKEKYIPVLDNVDTKVTVTHTYDFAKGLVGLYKNELAYEEDFHITSDETTTWNEILDILGNLLGKKVKKVFMPKEFLVSHMKDYMEIIMADKGNEWIFNNSKIKEAVPKYNCNIGLKSGLLEMIEFYENNPELKIVNEDWNLKIDELCNSWLETQWDKGHSDSKYHAIKANKEIREISASGGFFFILAEYVINELNGYVCAQMRNKDFSFVISQSMEDLKGMLEYVYVQGKTELPLDEIKNLLSNKKNVLFLGTPCQVAKVKMYLGGEYENLYLVDNFCTGVTPVQVLQTYIKEYFPKKRISTISFRDKSFYRWCKSLNIVFDDGSVFREDENHNVLLKLMKREVCLKSECNIECRFKQGESCSDIQIGDFWAAGQYDKIYGTNLFDSAGVSLVGINTRKGKDIFSAIKNKFAKDIQLDRVFLKQYLYKNVFFSSNDYYLENRKKFFRIMEQFGFEKAYMSVVENRKDVAVLGLWNGGNYGAIITANALYEIIENFGYKAEFIDTTINYNKRDNYLLEYITSRCDTSKRYSNIGDCYELNEKYESFVVGSDQCWHTELTKLYNDIFLLGFVNDTKNKISYATSFGPSKFSNSDSKQKFKSFLNKFDAVSVREKSGVDICNNLFEVEASWVLDPILLREKSVYEKETADIEISPKENYVLNYLLDIRLNTMDIVDNINEKVACEKVCRILGVDFTNPWDKEISDLVQYPTVYEFIKYFLECKYIVTDSYHGMCLAILFNKPFNVIINEGRGRDRFDSLLEKLGLESRGVEYADFEKQEVISDIVWDAVNEKLSKFRAYSLRWLQNALAKEKDADRKIEDYMDIEMYRQNIIIKVLQDEINMIKRREYHPYAKDIIKLFSERISYNSLVLFRGGGYHTRKLLEIILPILEHKQAKLIILDNNPNTIYIGSKKFESILPSSKIIKDADVIVISTWRYRKELLDEVVSCCKGLAIPPEIIELYDELNLSVSQPFYVDENWIEY